jgi:hypothetical protein
MVFPLFEIGCLQPNLAYSALSHSYWVEDRLLRVNLIQTTPHICMWSFIMMFISEGVQKEILQIVHHLLLDVYIAL